jgi:hypothetical protein
VHGKQDCETGERDHETPRQGRYPVKPELSRNLQMQEERAKGVP